MTEKCSIYFILGISTKNFFLMSKKTKTKRLLKDPTSKTKNKFLHSTSTNQDWELT